MRNIGDRCFTEGHLADGTCKLLSNCPRVVADIVTRRLPTVCGRAGEKTIVCCPT